MRPPYDRRNWSIKDIEAAVAAGTAFSIYDIEAEACAVTFLGHRSKLVDFGFSPDGKQVVSGAMDGVLKLWEATTGKPVATFGAGEDSVAGCAFSPDGTLIASLHTGNRLNVWDAESLVKIGQFRSDALIEQMIWGPNSERLTIWGPQEAYLLQVENVERFRLGRKIESLVRILQYWHSKRLNE
jgi:WD40 repeat protein